MDKEKLVEKKYFEMECSVDTSVREAYHLGFSRAVSKLKKFADLELWEVVSSNGVCNEYYECPKCSAKYPKDSLLFLPIGLGLINHCPNCNAIWRRYKI